MTRRWATAVGPAGVPLPDTDELFDAVIWQYGDVARLADGRPATSRVTAASRRADAPATAPGGPRRRPRCGARGRRCTRSCSPAASTVELERRCSPCRRAAPPARRRADVHHLLHADARRHVLRRLARAARRPARPARHLPPAGGHHRRGRDRPGRRRRAGRGWPARPRTGPSTATSSTPSPTCCARSATSSTVPTSPPWWPSARWRTSARASTGGSTEPPRRPRAARAPPPDAGRRRHAPGRRARPSSPRPSRTPRGYWAGPVGWVDARGDGEWMIGIRSAPQRRTPDGHATVTPPRRRRHRRRLGPRGRGGGDQRQARHRARHGDARGVSGAAVRAPAPAPDSGSRGSAPRRGRRPRASPPAGC